MKHFFGRLWYMVQATVKTWFYGKWKQVNCDCSRCGKRLASIDTYGGGRKIEYTTDKSFLLPETVDLWNTEQTLKLRCPACGTLSETTYQDIKVALVPPEPGSQN